MRPKSREFLLKERKKQVLRLVSSAQCRAVQCEVEIGILLVRNFGPFYRIAVKRASSELGVIGTTTSRRFVVVIVIVRVKCQTDDAARGSKTRNNWAHSSSRHAAAVRRCGCGPACVVQTKSLVTRRDATRLDSKRRALSSQLQAPFHQLSSKYRALW